MRDLISNHKTKAVGCDVVGAYQHWRGREERGGHSLGRGFPTQATTQLQPGCTSLTCRFITEGGGCRRVQRAAWIYIVLLSPLSSSSSSREEQEEAAPLPTLVRVHHLAPVSFRAFFSPPILFFPFALSPIPESAAQRGAELISAVSRLLQQRHAEARSHMGTR